MSAAVRYDRSDSSTFEYLDAALRMNLRNAISDKMDAEVLTRAAAPKGLLAFGAAPTKNAAGVENAAHALTAIFAGVDGKYASMASEVKMLLGTATYADLGSSIFDTGSGVLAGEKLAQVAGGLRVSSHVPAKVASGEDALIVKGMGRRNCVSAMWDSVEIGVIEDGGLVLASECEVTGGPQPSSWHFKVTLDGPSRSQTWALGYDDICLFQWSADPHHPWAGVGPLQRASVSAALLANVEKRMSEEASAVSGHLLSVPDSDSETIGTLQEDLRNLKGRTAFVRTSKNWASEEGKSAAGVPGEYVQRRIGAAVPEPNITLRESAGMDLVAACGVPGALFRSDADGTASRAALSRWLDFSVQPIADGMAAEFSRKLGVLVTLGFDDLKRADTILTLARATATLAKAGVSVGEALDAVGLGED